MNQTPESPVPSPSLESTASNALERLSALWGFAVQVAACPACDWSYLLAAGAAPGRCPHCFQADLQALGAQIEQLPYSNPPELALPFTLSAAALASGVQSFARGIPFPPTDLEVKTLSGRLRRVYLPTWLVDADVQAAWQVEAGFNYDVVSHQDHYDGAGWSSRQVQERRVRWEPRLGRLGRAYQNISAPALEDHPRLRAALGDFNPSTAAAYQAKGMQKAFVRLPDRPPQDAWSDALPAFQAAAAEECRRAAAADHTRQFTWQPQFSNQNWTLLLQPVYTTYYLDDDGKPQPVMVNGQNGHLHGARRASMKRATRASLSLLGAALLAFLAGLALMAISIAAPPVLVFGILGMLLAFGLGLAAIYPLMAAWWFNRNKAAT